MDNPYQAPHDESAVPAPDGPTLGLMVRACLVGLVVQVMVGVITRGADFLVFRKDDLFPMLTTAFVLYIPIMIAAGMGYYQCQLDERAKTKRSRGAGNGS